MQLKRTRKKATPRPAVPKTLATKSPPNSQAPSGWTLWHLDFFRIRVNSQRADQFFRGTDLNAFPSKDIPPDLLSKDDMPELTNIRDIDHRNFYRMLYLADNPQNPETNVDDFAENLFELLGFREIGDITRQKPSHLDYGPSSHPTLANVRIGDTAGRIVLIHESKVGLRFIHFDDPLKYTFSEKVLHIGPRCTHECRPPTDSGRIAGVSEVAGNNRIVIGVIMRGTSPTFYRTTITPELVDAVRNSSTPEEDTIVEEFHPRVSSMATCSGRRSALKYFEALKSLLESASGEWYSAW